MFRRCSAVFLLMVMTLFITLQHPVLGYCYCLNTYFTGSCTCQAVKQVTRAAANDADSAMEQAPASGCLSCCSGSENKSSLTTSDPEAVVTSQSAAPLEPCDDCVESLVVDVGYYIWNASGKVPAEHQIQPEGPNPFHFITLSFQQRPQFVPHGLRAIPPPERPLIASSVPLFIDQCVFRL